MTLEFNINRSQYINTKGLELLKYLICENKELADRENPTVNTNSSYSFLKEKDFIDLTDRQVGPMYEFEEDTNGRIVERYRLTNKDKIGLDKSGFSELYVLVKNILKERVFNVLVSEKFLAESIFEWLLTGQNENPHEPLSDYILNCCNDKIQFYNVFIPILYLESDLNFIIGLTSFSYIKDQDIEYLASNINENSRKDYIASLKKYQGQLYGVCCIEAERNKAVEVANEQITISVDVLRLISPTVEMPDLVCYYDVDYRNIHQVSSHVLIQPRSILLGLGVDIKVKPKPFIIHNQVWEIMNKMGLKYIHDFIIKTLHDKTELERLIYKAIGNFSRAIATVDLHERIVQLFTVLESLLLSDENNAVIDSVCKYLPKIISKDLQERLAIVKTVKEMYKVRSAMIHHAVKKDFELSNLSAIQIYCRVLIFKFIGLSNEKKKKSEILKDIDNIILSA